MVPGQCTRCLVVDNDPLVRWSLVRFLESRCVEARSTESGELALALLQEWPVDLLIIGAPLPGMNVLELMKRCQGLQPRPGIILLIGAEAPSLPGALDQLGVLGVIEKPLILDALGQLLARVLQPSEGSGA